MRRLFFPLLALLLAIPAGSQAQQFTRADTLRGSWTHAERAWWDVAFYDLEVHVNPADSTLRGRTVITYRVLQPHDVMQVDLMPPLRIDSMVQDGRRVQVRSEGNAHFARLTAPQPRGATKSVTVHYSGRPTIAPRPPWDGGISWQMDSLGRPWVVTTDQGVGASIWWPNKDTQADEPDSMRFAVTVPQPLVHVGNGRLRSRTDNADNTTTFEWFVSSPINNYAIALNIANYVHWSDTFDGEKGPLTLDYWVLDYNVERSKVQFAQVKPMMECFERWFGPYPWYTDGFKLIDVPYPGMEHQSAVTYGNYYANGYRGRDDSGTGIGRRFDFIIVHESAHEWWANNITVKDQADMWVHEGFANYAESVHVECLWGKDAASQYVVGTRRGIGNDTPIIPARNVNAKGSGDMYPKGGNMLHTIRQLVGDDAKWRGILRGLQETFGRQTVTGQQVRDYMSERAGIDLEPVFRQYLETTQIPELQYRIEDGTLFYRWTNVVNGFDMPVEVTLAPGAAPTVLHATTEWQTLRVNASAASLAVDPDYYVTARRMER